MKFKALAAAATIQACAVATPALAQDATAPVQPRSVTIDIAGHPVPVVAGGLYDRYRSNPPLSVIAAEAPQVDLSWVQGLKKTKVDAGFETYSPNLYYTNNSITAVFTADIDRLRELIPAQVLEQARPLQIWPGRGVVALTAYRYQYCDNDSYNEIALSIVTTRPGGSNLGPFSLLGQLNAKNMWGYVLKLPVNTELARVRGVVGYNLPKWLTPINYREGEDAVTFEIFDSKTGQVDFVFSGRKLDGLSKDASLVTTNFTNLDQKGQLTHGHSVTRRMSYASSRSDAAVQLTLGDGELSRYIKSLKLGQMLRYEYMPEFQLALYAPEPLATFLEKD